MALTDDLIAYWPLNEAANADALDGFDSQDLTDVGGVASAAGKGTDTARLFVAANSESFVRVSEAALVTGNIDFTIACRVYLTNTTTIHTLMSKYGTNSNDEYGLFVEGNPDTTALFSFAIVDGLGNQTTLYASTFGQPLAATWYDVRAWHDAGNNLMGIEVVDTDGTPYADTQAYDYPVGPADHTGPFRLGALGDDPGLFFSGRMDEAAFWKRVLTDEEWAEVVLSDDGWPLAEVGSGFVGFPVPLGMGVPPPPAAGMVSLLGFWAGGAGVGAETTDDVVLHLFPILGVGL